MKNFFDKIKSYSFWVSFSAALIMLLNALGNAFGFEIENKVVEDVVMSIAGILAVLGIVTMNDKKANTEQDLEENETAENENSEENSDAKEENLKTEETKEEVDTEEENSETWNENSQENDSDNVNK